MGLWCSTAGSTPAPGPAWRCGEGIEYFGGWSRLQSRLVGDSHATDLPILRQKHLHVLPRPCAAPIFTQFMANMKPKSRLPAVQLWRVNCPVKPEALSKNGRRLIAN